MLSVLNITNFALIDELTVEFERGLNLLTGETGSGKSIIVDALGVLIGGRFAADHVKSGAQHAAVEGLFAVGGNPRVAELLAGAGLDGGGASSELVIRRELAAAGRGRIYVNNRLATLALLRDLRPFLVDIHGQGDQQTLFNPDTHLELLDAFGRHDGARREVAALYASFATLRRELAELRRDEAEKLQLIDALRFQTEELEAARLSAGEEESLTAERRLLVNLERVAELSADAYDKTYERDDSTVARLSLLAQQIGELSQYEASYADYLEGVNSARALVEDLGVSLRSFASGLKFSPERLAEIEARLAEVARLKRKYGGTVESALEHLARSRERLERLERADERAAEITRELSAARTGYLAAARKLHAARAKAAREFGRSVERALTEVAMESAKFVVEVGGLPDDADDDAVARASGATGTDRVEFQFSANVGEPPRPLARVASGGEASRLMLVLKTIIDPAQFPRTIVFDEIDTGIGGRVSEAVGLKLKRLAASNQVLCVTHQAQIARFADSHLLVSKRAAGGATEVNVRRLERAARVEEIARMLTGAQITETARRHAREMLKTA
ncbi:MAG TPA: DNA repair protein RecN [Pyrinomonadaceae bacterium]|nr:DNA repair protein RecN [Pyrinomonadaceae bacterium]